MVFPVIYSAHRHPFGLGARACIGRHFAMQEALLLIATFGQRYHLRLVPNHQVVPYSSPTLHPRFGLPMTITRR